MTAALSNPPLIQRMRPAADWAITRTTAVVPGTRVDTIVGSPSGEWVRAPGAADGAGVVLVLHGSGYLICSARTHGYWLWPRDHGRTSLQTAGQFLRTVVTQADPAS
ncbi:hypothetical protein [Mycobacterium sp.]|uniref:hypothetical protein n=1 Tax=Mycobacterium sp. TaxID=1785 RepID=UPI0025E0C8AB|nr:hypothetical protein [Mycobacterium sp.]